MFYECGEGVLASEHVALAARGGLLSQRVTRGQTRSAVSLIALLCDDTGIQAKLPQYVLGNENVLPQSIRSELVAEGVLLPNVELVRRKSAWVDDAILALIAGHWGRVLWPERGRYQPILLVDACPAHMGRRFLRALARWGIWVVFLPARLTWLLQPADTHCFASFKRALRTWYHEALVANNSGTVGVKEVLLHVNRAIRIIMQGTRWSSAFQGNGFGSHQRGVRARILEHLKWTALQDIGSELPVLRQFESIFPRNRDMPLADILMCHRHPRAKSTGEPVAPVDDDGDPPVASAGVWHKRLRSNSNVCTDVSAGSGLPASSSAPAPLPPPLPPPPCPPRPAAPQAAPWPWAQVPVGRPLLSRRSRSSIEASTNSQPPEPPGQTR